MGPDILSNAAAGAWRNPLRHFQTPMRELSRDFAHLRPLEWALSWAFPWTHWWDVSWDLLWGVLEGLKKAMNVNLRRRPTTL